MSAASKGLIHTFSQVDAGRGRDDYAKYSVELRLRGAAKLVQNGPGGGVGAQVHLEQKIHRCGEGGKSCH